MAFKQPIRVTPETHRLTNLPGEKHPHKCQRCGGGKLSELERWQECDHNDKPELFWLVLCAPCSRAVIKQHPRLYQPIQPFAPVPGCMSVCVNCSFRDGVRCKNPDAKINDGKIGLKYDQSEPSWAFIDGPRYRGRVAIYSGPVKSCSGFSTGKLTAEERAHHDEVLKRCNECGDGADIEEFQAICKHMEEKYGKPIAELL